MKVIKKELPEGVRKKFVTKIGKNNYNVQVSLDCGFKKAEEK